MTRFTFVTWDGGGNLPPAIGIAQELAARWNQVRFLGYEVQRAAIESRGLAFSALPRSGSFDLYSERAPEQRLPAIIRNVWACPEHVDDIPDDLAAHPADVLVVDFLMQGALAQARRTDIPVVVLAHSTVAGIVPPPDSPMGSARLAAANGFRASIGLPRMERLNDGWEGLPTIVTTIAELDSAADSAPDTVHYVGPIAEGTPRSTWEPPWASNDQRPLVLVSFSTTRLWDPTSRIRNTLAALADEPVRVLVIAGEECLPPEMPDGSPAVGVGDDHALRSRHSDRLASSRSADRGTPVPGSRPAVSRRANPGVGCRTRAGRRVDPVHHKECRS